MNLQPDIGQSVDLITSNAITPAEIREAVRRLCLQRGPFADFVVSISVFQFFYSYPIAFVLIQILFEEGLF